MLLTICFVHNLAVEAISKNQNFETVTTGIQDIRMFWEAVADGVSISANVIGGPAMEDENFTVGVTWESLDIDGSEVIGEWVFMEFDRDDVELIGYTKVEGPFTFQGKTLSWYYIIPYSEIGSLQIHPPVHWHGDITGTLFMNGTETIEPYPVLMSDGSFSFPVTAVADAPLLGVPTETVIVLENEVVTIPDLFASLVDTVGENGIEDISIVFEGVPEDSFFTDASGLQVGAPSIGGKCLHSDNQMGNDVVNALVLTESLFLV